jgi:ATP-binding cassette, subfamily B, bacterial
MSDALPDSVVDPPSWRARLRSLKNIRLVFSLAWQTNRYLIIASFCLRLVRSIVPVLALWVTKLLLDAVVSTVTQHARNSYKVWHLFVMDMLIYVLADLLGRGSALIEGLLADQVIGANSILIMEHGSSLGLAHFEDPAFQDVLERVRRQSSARLGILAFCLNSCQDIVGLVIFAAILSRASPWLFVFLLVAVIPVFIGQANLSAIEYSILRRRTPQRRKLDYLRFLGASLLTIKEVTLFALAEPLVDRYCSEWNALYKENEAMAFRRSWTSASLNVFATIGTYAGFALIVSRTLAGQLSVGTFMFLTRSFYRCCSIVSRLFSGVGSISDSTLLVDDLAHFLQLEPSVSSHAGSVLPMPRPVRRGIEFRNVSFKYPGSDRWSLRDVSFELRSAEKLALVGPNGAGKSTIAKLIMRLYDPTEGEVLLDGVDIREYEVTDLRRNISAVFQDYVRYDLSVSENIGFGDIDRMGDQSTIKLAAHMGCASQLIDSFPGGYDQSLGRRFDGGVELSGGEWQRIALARACMRPEAQLWILDEPTSAVDADTEHRWFRQFRTISANKMGLIISHRFSTVRLADRILVLSHGSIQEEGTHEELLFRNQRYAVAFHSQAARYR